MRRGSFRALTRVRRSDIDIPIFFSRFGRTFRAIFGNKRFLCFGLAIIALYMCYMIILPVVPCFVTVILGKEEGFALSTIILPLLFENFGYTKGHDLGIRLVFVMLGAVSLIGFFILFGYRLGDSPEETRELMGMEQ